MLENIYTYVVGGNNECMRFFFGIMSDCWVNKLNRPKDLVFFKKKTLQQIPAWLHSQVGTPWLLSQVEASISRERGWDVCISVWCMYNYRNTWHLQLFIDRTGRMDARRRRDCHRRKGAPYLVAIRRIQWTRIILDPHISSPSSFTCRSSSKVTASPSLQVS